MTRGYGERMECPHCGQIVTIETEFSRWLRNHPELESRKGFTATDHDVRWHRFRTERGRAFECMMNIEIKTHGSELTDSQRDTMHIENQLIRNRRATPTKDLLYQRGTTIRKAYSVMKGCDVNIRHFGNHVLRFSGLGPQDSEWIMWDLQHIDTKTLLAILKFDLDPDTLRPMDWRSHHKKAPQPLELPFLGLQEPA